MRLVAALICHCAVAGMLGSPIPRIHRDLLKSSDDECGDNHSRLSDSSRIVILSTQQEGCVILFLHYGCVRVSLVTAFTSAIIRHRMFDNILLICRNVTNAKFILESRCAAAV